MSQIVLYCYRTDASLRLITPTFEDAESARAFFDILSQGGEYVEEPCIVPSQHQVLTTTGIRVRSDALQDVLNVEGALELDVRRMRQARQFLIDLPAPEDVKETIQEERAERRAARVAKKQRTQQVRQARADKATVADLVAGIEMDPKEARAILRKMGMVKPAEGWVFAHTEVANIRSLLIENRK